MREKILKKISIGKSGANVYELENNRIAKHVLHNQIEDASLWEAYRKEALFYSTYSESEYSFLPKVYSNICTNDEILIIMKKYHPIAPHEVDEALLCKIMDVLAKIHNMKIPDLWVDKDRSPIFLDDTTISESMDGWQKVLKAHGDYFASHWLQTIGENINQLNTLFFEPQVWLIHGDFHCDNIMLDEDGNVIVCDWQNYSAGEISGDISFLLSRLSAGGFKFNQSKVIEMYCKCAKELGISVDPWKIDTQMRLANLNTSFRFWHIYLHNATRESVESIYSKMTKDAEVLIQR